MSFFHFLFSSSKKCFITSSWVIFLFKSIRYNFDFDEISRFLLRTSSKYLFCNNSLADIRIFGLNYKVFFIRDSDCSLNYSNLFELVDLIILHMFSTYFKVSESRRLSNWFFCSNPRTSRIWNSWSSLFTYISPELFLIGDKG